MWARPKQLTQKWETVATKLRRVPHTAARQGWLGKKPRGEHVAQAKATHPGVGGSGDGSLILPHGGDD